MPIMSIRYPILALLLLGASSGPAASDEFLERFTGKWAGSGMIQRDIDASPRNVSCSLASAGAAGDKLSLQGSCRAALVVTRKIGADIEFDAASGRYSGVYLGSTKGPATVVGRRRGDAIVLTITYGAVIYGDRTATMTITNADDGSFRMTVVDKVDGKNKQTSDISFSRS
jgi:hypothetical protein